MINGNNNVTVKLTVVGADVEISTTDICEEKTYAIKNTKKNKQDCNA